MHGHKLSSLAISFQFNLALKFWLRHSDTWIEIYFWSQPFQPPACCKRVPARTRPIRNDCIMSYSWCQVLQKTANGLFIQIRCVATRKRFNGWSTLRLWTSTYGFWQTLNITSCCLFSPLTTILLLSLFGCSFLSSNTFFTILHLPPEMRWKSSRI